MIKVFDIADSSGKPATQQIANLAEWSYFYVQVFGAGTLRLAATDRELTTPIAPGPLNGLQITMADGIVPMRWKGPLWGIGSAPNTVADFQFPGSQP